MSWLEDDFFERPNILAQRDFRLRAAIDVIENGSGDAANCQPAEIGDVYHPGERSHSSEILARRAHNGRAISCR